MLDAAQLRWPEETDRKALLLRLATVGSDAIAKESHQRQNAVAETAGALSGIYLPDELQRLREDWPA